ncbi:MAG TPA: ABC transporter ATP-binding protein [Planctomycetota bacterium]|nr:ABC transporter ATP-binding protein [Planctomycetota bacterium]
MIEIQGLVKTYDGTRAVAGLDLTVGRGVFFTFLGPNGAGKTTTMKVMAGLLEPTAGTVLIDGIDVVKEPVKAKARIGYIPDHPFLYGKLTGWEFLRFVAGLYRMDHEAARARGASLLEVFDLTSEADRLIDTYSHGMRQRLAFAACFLHNPSVVIIDEPWVGLDPRNIRAAIEFLRTEATKGTTIFMSTHSLDIAEEVAERIGIIHHGKLIYDGSVDALQRGSTQQDLEEIFLAMTD